MCCAPWLRDSEWLVILTVPDEPALLNIVTFARAAEHPHVAWCEPDLDSQLTAVALAPGQFARSLCGPLPLLGRETVMT